MHSGGIQTCTVVDPGNITHLDILPVLQQSLVVHVCDKPALQALGRQKP